MAWLMSLFLSGSSPVIILLVEYFFIDTAVVSPITNKAVFLGTLFLLKKLSAALGLKNKTASYFLFILTGTRDVFYTIISLTAMPFLRRASGSSLLLRLPQKKTTSFSFIIGIIFSANLEAVDAVSLIFSSPKYFFARL